MIDKEDEAFQALLMSQFARLAEQSGCYIKRLSNEDRSAVLGHALTAMQIVCEEFNPLVTTLMESWNFCLREALLQRAEWRLRHIEGWRRTKTQTMLMAVPWGGL